jgi:hypothetical protein
MPEARCNLRPVAVAGQDLPGRSRLHGKIRRPDRQRELR